MNQYQTAIAVMAACGVGPRDAEGRPRQFTVEELDAPAEFRLPGAGVVGRLAACVAAAGSRMNSRAGMRVEPLATPSAEAAARTPA